MSGPTELGRAVHAWRDRITPGAVGLPAGSPRRAPGLRREELAVLANLSVDYLVRLEQGRAVNPSPQVLSALARALRLNTAERDHLYVLGGHAPPSPSHVSDHVPPSVQRLIDQLATAPLSVYDAVWNLISWNSLWAALLGDPSELNGRMRNAAWWAFAGPPDLFPHTPTTDGTTRTAIVSDLRAATVRYPADAALRSLIHDLCEVSADFVALWNSGAVGVHELQTKTIDHPAVGVLTLDCDILTAHAADLRIIAYSAAPGTEAAERLQLLQQGLFTFSTGSVRG